MSRDMSQDYLSALPMGQPQTNNSKIENYKRIKAEEAAARAQLLMGPIARPLEASGAAKVRNSELGPHKRNPSYLAGGKYKPSENALASYSPLRS